MYRDVPLLFCYRLDTLRVNSIIPALQILDKGGKEDAPIAPVLTLSA